MCISVACLSVVKPWAWFGVGQIKNSANTSRNVKRNLAAAVVVGATSKVDDILLVIRFFTVVLGELIGLVRYVLTDEVSGIIMET
jgi:hypothetical protein